MININIKIFICIILGCAFIIYVALFLINQNIESLSFMIALRDLSTTISITTVLSFFFIKFLWKCKFLYKWLVPFPNLTGKWEGYIKSDWTPEQEIPATVQIKQSFTTITLKGKTKESSFQSITSTFNIDVDRNINQLIYTYDYTSKSLNRENNPMHFGSVIINFDEGKTVVLLEGEYWTTRKTKGEIYLKRVS